MWLFGVFAPTRRNTLTYGISGNHCFEMFVFFVPWEIPHLQFPNNVKPCFLEACPDCHMSPMIERREGLRKTR